MSAWIAVTPMLYPTAIIGHGWWSLSPIANSSALATRNWRKGIIQHSRPTVTVKHCKVLNLHFGSILLLD